MTDPDTILTAEDKKDIKAYLKEKQEGYLVPFKDVEHEFRIEE